MKKLVVLLLFGLIAVSANAVWYKFGLGTTLKPTNGPIGFHGTLSSRGTNGSSSPTTPTNSADTFLNFHTQTPGARYNTNLIQSDVYGNPSTWSVVAEDPAVQNDKTFTNCLIPNFTFDNPIKTPDGHVAFGTGTNGVIQDISQGSNGTMILKYTGFTAHRSSVDFWLSISNVVAPNAGSYDLYLFFSNPYSVAQFGLDDNNVAQFGSPVRSGAHTSIIGPNPSTVRGVPTNTWIHGRLVQDYPNGITFIKYVNATNSSLIFSSIGYGSNTTVDTQSFFKFEGGYIYVNDNLGYIARSGIYLQADANVQTNMPPWVPVAPSAVSASQVGTAIQVNFTDNCYMLNSNRFSISNGADGEIPGWAPPSSNSVLITGMTGGTYDVRGSSYFIDGIHSSVVSGGTVNFSAPTWFDSFAFGSSDGFVDQTAAQYNFSSVVGPIGSAVTLSKIRVGISNVFTAPVDILFGVFDANGGTLVYAWESYGETATGQIEFTLPLAQTLTIGHSYYVATTANCNAGTILYYSLSLPATGLQCNNPNNDWLQFPQNPLASTFVGFTPQISVGMLMQ